MFDQLSAEILASLIKGFPTTTTTTRTTKQNVDPAVHFVYSRVKIERAKYFLEQFPTVVPRQHVIHGTQFMLIVRKNCFRPDTKTGFWELISHH
jgi:hypothetical protein